MEPFCSNCKFHELPTLGVMAFVLTLSEESTGAPPKEHSLLSWWPHMPLALSISVIFATGSGPLTGSGREVSGFRFMLSGWNLHAGGWPK